MQSKWKNKSLSKPNSLKNFEYANSLWLEWNEVRAVYEAEMLLDIENVNIYSLKPHTLTQLHSVPLHIVERVQCTS